MPHWTDFTTQAETVALFRYGVIADLRDVRPGDRTLHTRLEEKAAREYDIPGHDAAPRRRGHPARLGVRLSPGRLRRAETEARRDVGRARALPPSVGDALCTLKEEAPTFSVLMLIATARQRGLIPADLELAPRPSNCRFWVANRAVRPCSDNLRLDQERKRRRPDLNRDGGLG